MSSQAASSGFQVEVTLNSAFASRKRTVEDEKQGQPAMVPSHFQVYTKIDEETRKDNKLVISFLLTLNDTRGMVTYEFRGICAILGSSADFESVMETSKNSRVPKILDILYQKLYPAMFMLAGMTASSYPQSVALMTDMVSTEPVQVRQQFVAVAEGGHETKTDVGPSPAAKDTRITPSTSAVAKDSRFTPNASPVAKDFRVPPSKVTIPKIAPPKIAKPKVDSRTGTADSSKSGSDKSAA